MEPDRAPQPHQKLGRRRRAGWTRSLRAESRRAAELCVAHDKPYVTLDSPYDDYVAQNAAAVAISHELRDQAYAGRDMREVFGHETVPGRALAHETALEELPEKEREVLELAYLSEMSQSEVADYLNIPLGTVKTRTRSALSRLAGLLEGELA